VREWVFLGVWVLALVLTCAGFVALLKFRNVGYALTVFLTVSLVLLVLTLTLLPLVFIFVPI
jgi:hypothetical protein